MRACQHCGEPIPDGFRADALYCSTRCKLKAQRWRNKGHAVAKAVKTPIPIETATQQLVSPSPLPAVSQPFEPVDPLANAQQLDFPFMPSPLIPRAAPLPPSMPVPGATYTWRPAHGSSVVQTVQPQLREGLPPSRLASTAIPLPRQFAAPSAPNTDPFRRQKRTKPASQPASRASQTASHAAVSPQPSSAEARQENARIVAEATVQTVAAVGGLVILGGQWIAENAPKWFNRLVTESPGRNKLRTDDDLL